MAARVELAPDTGLQQRLARVDELVGELTTLPDPGARALAEEVISTVLELHGAALARLLELVLGTGEDGGRDGDATLRARLVADPLIRHILLLHDLHPLDLRTRVEGALESVRPYMRSHGGGVELVAVQGDTVRIRLEGHCNGCPSSMMTLKGAVEKAIHEAAPDVAAIEVAEPSDVPVAPPQFTVCPLPLATVAS